MKKVRWRIFFIIVFVNEINTVLMLCLTIGQSKITLPHHSYLYEGIRPKHVQQSFLYMYQCVCSLCSPLCLLFCQLVVCVCVCVCVVHLTSSLCSEIISWVLFGACGAGSVPCSLDWIGEPLYLLWDSSVSSLSVFWPGAPGWPCSTSWQSHVSRKKEKKEKGPPPWWRSQLASGCMDPFCLALNL